MSSYVSNLSYQNNLDRESVGEGSTGESGIEDNDALDQEFDVALEAAALKNTVVRTKNLKIIQDMMTGKIMGEILYKRKMEVVDVIVKSLKNGKPGEKVLTAHIAVLYTLQMGSEAELEDFYSQIKPLFLGAISDHTFPDQDRGRMLFRLATLCFLCSDNIEDRKELLTLIRQKIKQTDCDMLINTAASLSLILTICTPTERKNSIQMLLSPVRELLKHSNVDVRIEAGELIAHIFELGRDYDEEFDSQVDDLETLITDLETLSSDSARFRAKRDRKQQRASFREILASVNGDESVHETVKVSIQESLALGSWSEKVQYSAIKESLGGSTSLHLQQSVFVREIVGLGPPPLRVEKISKAEKHEMKKLNAACHKARQKNMAKQRDKRMVV